MTEDDGKLEAPSAKQAAEAVEAKKAKMIKAGIGLGIGSAAIAAALLYVNHNKVKRDE
jgi:homoserine kinase